MREALTPCLDEENMEKRLILAIVLSFLILFLFQLIFVKPQPQSVSPEPTEMGAKTEAVPTEPASDEINKIKQTEKSASGQPQVESGEVITSEREQEITIDTPLYTAVWSNKGGVLKSWKLKNHLKKIPNRKIPSESLWIWCRKRLQLPGCIHFHCCSMRSL